MRAPFQVLVIPFVRGVEERIQFAALRRSDSSEWQGVAGGGEVGETPEEAALREASEELGVSCAKRSLIKLQTMASIPVIHFRNRQGWPDGQYVIPEYSFGIELESGFVSLSDEHNLYRWGVFEEINSLLRWDSNRTALWELNERLVKNDIK
ncbi:NUDIX domain-containing protein [Burkholderia plantarii]|uniref:NUDIX domain-containing protein n=1 Tax=Burkholderia plantarii TaxID=41899 RepID=UPI0008707B55|nr:NUDIX domain-containing protein [Burkholderia plantarii]